MFGKDICDDSRAKGKIRGAAARGFSCHRFTFEFLNSYLTILGEEFRTTSENDTVLPEISITGNHTREPADIFVDGFWNTDRFLTAITDNAVIEQWRVFAVSLTESSEITNRDVSIPFVPLVITVREGIGIFQLGSETVYRIVLPEYPVSIRNQTPERWRFDIEIQLSWSSDVFAWAEVFCSDPFETSFS
jgi:hypothetical protein